LSRCRSVAAAAAAALALLVAGCGASSSSSSSTVVKRVKPPAPLTTTSTSSTTTAKHPTTTTTSTTSSSMPAPTTSAASSSTQATAPPPTPAGTPSAPDGLAQTTGYAMYENCSSHCSGAVPLTLRRRLEFPAIAGHTCPLGTSPGPLTPNISTRLHVSPFLGSQWDGAEVTWSAPRGFSGPILIRGRELDGPLALGFGEGHVPYDELQMYAAPGASRTWQTFTRVRGPGCYAYQVDTTRTTEVFVFEATR